MWLFNSLFVKALFSGFKRVMLTMHISYLWWTHISPCSWIYFGICSFVIWFSRVSGQVFLGKFIHVALSFSRVDVSVQINLFMNSRIYYNRKYMGLDATNVVLLRFKPACSAMEASWKIKISLETSSDMMFSKRWKTKAQICPRGSAPLLFAPYAPKTSFLALRTIYENMLTSLRGMFFV